MVSWQSQDCGIHEAEGWNEKLPKYGMHNKACSHNTRVPGTLEARLDIGYSNNSVSLGTAAWLVLQSSTKCESTQRLDEMHAHLAPADQKPIP
jgi:hypothetical protein